MKDETRRKLLKGLAVTLPAAWTRPVVESVVLPAHAQATACGEATFIRVVSPESNGAERFIVITDNSDNVLAKCCCGGTDIIIQASSLAAGTYRVFADSGDPINHTVLITTECGTTSITVPTADNEGRALVATLMLPAGSVVPANGELVGGSIAVPNINCLQGGS